MSRSDMMGVVGAWQAREWTSAINRSTLSPIS